LKGDDYALLLLRRCERSNLVLVAMFATFVLTAQTVGI
jgi:hypothetical protein